MDRANIQLFHEGKSGSFSENFSYISVMDKKSAIKLFNQNQIRTHWDDEQESWYFSIVDVLEALTGTDRPRKYWSDLKTKLKKEGSELSEKLGRLKLIASDGKYYKTDVANTEQLIFLLQLLIH